MATWPHVCLGSRATAESRVVGRGVYLVLSARCELGIIIGDHCGVTLRTAVVQGCKMSRASATFARGVGARTKAAERPSQLLSQPSTWLAHCYGAS